MEIATGLKPYFKYDVFNKLKSTKVSITQRLAKKKSLTDFEILLIQFFLQVTENLSVKTLMDTWTLQEGLPYINVSIDTTGKHITLHQQIFLANPDAQLNIIDGPFG